MIEALEPRDNSDLKALIRTVPDFPRPGIQFHDITTLMLDPAGFTAAIERMSVLVDSAVDLVAGIEARGFLFAAPLAVRLGVGLVPIRKLGKLPGATRSEAYALEYGTDSLAIHADACGLGSRVLLVDDLIATGGTARAATRLLASIGAEIDQALFLVDLPDLGGAEALRGEGVRTRSRLLKKSVATASSVRCVMRAITRWRCEWRAAGGCRRRLPS